MILRATRKKTTIKKRSTSLSTDVKKPFIEHVEELRARLVMVAITFIVGSGIGYVFRAPIQTFIVKPLNQPLYFTTPTGGFDFVVSVSLLFGFLTTIPVLLYHLVKFIEPIMPNHLHRLTLSAVIGSFLLAIGGLNFAYWVGLPASLKFLSHFTDGSVTALISADKYISFVMFYLIGCTIIFQLPLMLILINSVTKLETRRLWYYFPYVVLGSFVIAALATPTSDPLNQTIMALPVIVLYGISTLIIILINRRQ